MIKTLLLLIHFNCTPVDTTIKPDSIYNPQFVIEKYDPSEFYTEEFTDTIFTDSLQFSEFKDSQLQNEVELPAAYKFIFSVDTIFQISPSDVVTKYYIKKSEPTELSTKFYASLDDQKYLIIKPSKYPIIRIYYQGDNKILQRATYLNSKYFDSRKY